MSTDKEKQSQLRERSDSLDTIADEAAELSDRHVPAAFTERDELSDRHVPAAETPTTASSHADKEKEQSHQEDGHKHSKMHKIAMGMEVAAAAMGVVSACLVFIPPAAAVALGVGLAIGLAGVAVDATSKYMHSRKEQASGKESPDHDKDKTKSHEKTPGKERAQAAGMDDKKHEDKKQGKSWFQGVNKWGPSTLGVVALCMFAVPPPVGPIAGIALASVAALWTAGNMISNYYAEKKSSAAVTPSETPGKSPEPAKAQGHERTQDLDQSKASGILRTSHVADELHREGVVGGAQASGGDTLPKTTPHVVSHETGMGGGASIS